MLYANALKRLVVAMIIVISLPVLTWPQHATWQGKVVGVSDGDTITVLHDGKAEIIILYGIDCPEKKQSFGKRAKKFTYDMVFGKNVEVEPVTTDRHGGTTAWVNIDGTTLNEELLKAGLAWHYKKYSSEWHLTVLEAQARRSKVGLWRHPRHIPPWDYRSGKRSGKR